MMRSLVAACCVVCATAGCAVAAQPDGRVVQANNGFALDLYGRLREAPGNLFLSPQSVSTALDMTALGAGGDTARQMHRVLHWPEAQGPDHAALQDWLETLARSEGEVELTLANALWVQKDFPLGQPFAGRAAKHYGAAPRVLDFGHDPTGAARTINGWVDGETRGRIRELIDPAMLTPETRLVLTNAIYFKGAWASPFEEQMTREAAFRRPGADSVTAPFMNQQGRFPFAQDEHLQVLELPYADSTLAMDILLPRRADGLPELERGLSAADLTTRLAALEPTRVQVALPKFTLDLSLRLNQALAALGMEDAFVPGRADFSRMSSSAAGELYLQAVVHKAHVQVDEKGTTAAAASGVAVGITSIPPSFRADRPFFFVIRDTASGAILFMGRLVDPT